MSFFLSNEIDRQQHDLSASSRSPIRNVGIGLRTPHYTEILSQRPDVPWFEVLIDNYLGKGGSVYHNLAAICKHYPLTFHSVGLSLGATDPLDKTYLQHLRNAINDFQPAWISDHLCWTSVSGQHLHDLLPLPYTDEAIKHVATRIQQVQDYLGQRILLENVSSYLTYRHSCYSEAEFFSAVCESADCDMLLDINNVYVSASNHGFLAHEYLASLPAQRIREMHLAGYEDQGTFLLDTHGCAVHKPVWHLYAMALAHFGPVPTLIEWDNNIPALAVLLQEARTAQQYMDKAGIHVA